jgi:hypothetical protein
MHQNGRVTKRFGKGILKNISWLTYPKKGKGNVKVR